MQLIPPYDGEIDQVSAVKSQAKSDAGRVKPPVNSIKHLTFCSPENERAHCHHELI